MDGEIQPQLCVGDLLGLGLESKMPACWWASMGKVLLEVGPVLPGSSSALWAVAAPPAQVGQEQANSEMLGTFIFQ